MSLRGYNTRARGLRLPGILVILLVILISIYIFLKRMTTKTTAPEFYNKVKAAGFHSAIAQLVTAQAAHETAIAGVPFMSPVYLMNNNAFGMKNAGQALATGTNLGHATYNSVEDSIRDYKKWFDRRKPWFVFSPYLVTVAGFCRWLKEKNYFEASLDEYTKGVLHFYNMFY